MTHQIELNGIQVDPSSKKIRRKIAFVAQRDTLDPNATPRESIRFSARLHLARDVTDEEIEALTSCILTELNLDEVADRRIRGGWGGAREAWRFEWWRDARC